MEIRRRPPNPKVRVAHLEYAVPHDDEARITTRLECSATKGINDCCSPLGTKGRNASSQITSA